MFIQFILLFKSSGLRIEKKDPITDTNTYFTSIFWKEKENIILIRTNIFSYCTYFSLFLLAAEIRTFDISE